jgi:hypothetical protein
VEDSLLTIVSLGKLADFVNPPPSQFITGGTSQMLTRARECDPVTPRKCVVVMLGVREQINSQGLDI